MTPLEKTTDDAPPQLNIAEATAWVSGYDSGVTDALNMAAAIAEERGGADGLIIGQKIRNLLMHT